MVVGHVGALLCLCQRRALPDHNDRSVVGADPPTIRLKGRYSILNAVYPKPWESARELGARVLPSVPVSSSATA